MHSTHNLFSDGNYFPRAKRSGFGGYIQSPSGEVLTEFSEQITDKQYIQNFELLGIIRGLQIAKEQGIKHIISHCDDKTTAQRLKSIFEKGAFTIPPYGKPELYRKIMAIAESFDSISFKYIPRTQNKYADMLSRRYAVLLEKNFVNGYKRELQDSLEHFSSENHLPKRIFFTHPNFVKMLSRNNPYLVATVRNQRVRSLSRVEEKKNYSYVFFETFIQDEQQIFRLYHYNNQRSSQGVKEYSFPISNGEMKNCITVLLKILTDNRQERLWVFSNHIQFNEIMEQKSKISSTKEAEMFRPVYNAMDSYKQVLFHHFPFEHAFSRNLQERMKKQEKLKETYDSLDTILEGLKYGKESRDYSKMVGNLIRYHLKNYQQSINRELKDGEKTALIKTTVACIHRENYNPDLTKMMAA